MQFSVIASQNYYFSKRIYFFQLRYKPKNRGTTVNKFVERFEQAFNITHILTYVNQLKTTYFPYFCCK